MCVYIFIYIFEQIVFKVNLFIYRYFQYDQIEHLL